MSEGFWLRAYRRRNREFHRQEAARLGDVLRLRARERADCEEDFVSELRGVGGGEVGGSQVSSGEDTSRDDDRGGCGRSGGSIAETFSCAINYNAPHGA